MADVRTDLLVHPMVRVVPCCLCGAPWQEVYVSVNLIADGSDLGEVCPRCLSRPPRQTADLIRESAAQARALFEELTQLGVSPPPPCDELLARAARCVEEAARVRVLTHRVRDASARLRRLSQMHRMDGALALADELAVVPAWATTVPQVIQMERDVLLGKPWLVDTDLERFVDDRYRAFLEAA